MLPGAEKPSFDFFLGAWSLESVSPLAMHTGLLGGELYADLLASLSMLMRAMIMPIFFLNISTIVRAMKP